MDNKSALIHIARFTQAASMLLFVAMLYLARDVLVPMALGVLFAFMLTPVVNRLQHFGFSNTLAVIVTAMGVFAVTLVLIFGLWSGLSSFSDELPKYRQELKNKIAVAQTTIRAMGGQISRLSEDVADAVEKNSTPEAESSPTAETDKPSFFDKWISGERSGPGDGSSRKQPLYVVDTGDRRVDILSWAGSIAAFLVPVGTAGLVTIFALLALLYRDDLRDRFVSVISRGNYVVTTEALNEASARIGKYLLAQFILNVTYAVIFSLGLLAIGYALTPSGWFPYVALLGTVAGIVRFVPYAGPLIGAMGPIALAILLFPGYQVVVAVGVLILAMELISNNVAEPWFYGSSTGVSPVAILIATVFWAWLWGPIGLLLATPLTVCAVVLGQYVPRFKFLAMLLSEEINIKPAIRGYQRLLVGDQLKIDDFIASESGKNSVTTLLDRTIVPLTKLIANDKEKRERSDEMLYESLEKALQHAGLIPDEISELIDVETTAGGETEADSTDQACLPNGSDPRQKAVIIPVQPGGELIASKVIAHVLGDDLSIHVFHNDDIPDADAERIANGKPNIIVVCVIPPTGITQARCWCRSLRKSGFRGTLLVACLGKFKHRERLFASFRTVGANWLLTSADQTITKIRSIDRRSAARNRSTPKRVTTPSSFNGN